MRSSPRGTCITMTGPPFAAGAADDVEEEHGPAHDRVSLAATAGPVLLDLPGGGAAAQCREAPGHEVREPGGGLHRDIAHRGVSPEPLRKASAAGTNSWWCWKTPPWPESE